MLCLYAGKPVESVCLSAELTAATFLRVYIHFSCAEATFLSDVLGHLLVV